jgi:hypothetical protein
LRAYKTERRLDYFLTAFLEKGRYHSIPLKVLME